MGWVQTVDEYYTSRVNFILNSIIPSLEKNSQRRFIYVETAFFSRWWLTQDESMKSRTRALVDSGRLQFTLGHWSMPDEATTYYRDLITNGEFGMGYLVKEFGECGKPRVAWQIDPFGHSKGLAEIYHDMGFEALFLGRIDYMDYQKRKSEKSMEFDWHFGKNGKHWVDNYGILTRNFRISNIYLIDLTFSLTVYCWHWKY